jgi:SAM-dependent methyltransferase
MNSQEYVLLLEKQLKNSTKNNLKSYFEYLYKKIDREFKSESRLLEIGSGAGISRYFLGQKVERTDILPWRQNGVTGQINALSLPYNSNHFDGTFCVDVIHHLSDPIKAIEELLRVTTPGGKVIVIEPFVSVFSYPIYKIFHSEKATWKINLSDSGQVLSENPSEGDQGVSRSLFADKFQNVYIEQRFGEICNWKIDYFSPLSFFATGGLSRPLPTPALLIKIILKIESFLPQFILKFTASRILVTFSKY